MSLKKAEAAALAWPCSPLRPPDPFFGLPLRELAVLTLASSPASCPSLCCAREMAGSECSWGGAAAAEERGGLDGRGRRRTMSSLLSQNLTVLSWPTLAMKARSNVLRHAVEGGGD